METNNITGENFKLAGMGARPLPTTARRVLVVDDHRDSAIILAKVLKRAGHETEIAYDGLEAVEAAERWRPEVILLNIGMPVLDGHDAARRIRQQLWGKSTLLIAVTGDGQEEDYRKSKEAGFDYHLVKPVDCIALIKFLAECRPMS